MKTQGRIDYEVDCVIRPNYHDGSKRKVWSQLGEVEQWSWNRTIKKASGSAENTSSEAGKLGG